MLFLLISVHAEKLAEVSLLVIHLDLRNETQQILCLFHTLHITDAKESLVVLFLQGTILDMGSGISEYTGEHLAAIERTVHIAHKLKPVSYTHLKAQKLLAQGIALGNVGKK